MPSYAMVEKWRKSTIFDNMKEPVYMEMHPRSWTCAILFEIPSSSSRVYIV